MDLRPGIYESVISEAMEASLSRLDGTLEAETDGIPLDASGLMLSRYVQRILEKGLAAVRDRAASEAGEDGSPLKAEIDACNRVLELISELSEDEDILEWRIRERGERLLAIWNRMEPKLRRPRSPMSVSTLFTGGRRDIPVYEELCREIESSDEADLLVSFIKHSGLRLIRDSLERMTGRGGRVRVLTTTYMAATDHSAIKCLSEMRNTEIRISYDTATTRLHAKSYMFRRGNGLDSAFIGSSNLSGAAISDGMEWNVKLTEQDAPQIIAMMRSAFETYWASPDFEPYEDEQDHLRLVAALRKESLGASGTIPVARLDVRPYLFQQEILDDLEAERDVFGSYRNLVVAATGTGKTVISALDYRRFRSGANRDRLLYVAHRTDILMKSLSTYRAVLRDGNFGCLCDGNHEPDDIGHVFMTVASFESRKISKVLGDDYYDYIVVDETHHGAADSYQDLLDMHPKIMLGLTATPERMDGQDILEYFNGRIASEIRLPEAINRELLVPFQYFAVTDPASLTGIRFERGRFSVDDLETLYTKNGDERVRAVLDALDRYQPDSESIRGLGFCASIAHAEYMAAKFNEAGIPSMALSGNSDRDSRESAPARLGRGEIRFVFSVDIYNEGVDIPEVNTVLLLRPTDSMTVFVQQLGRGLRKCEGKSELTVLDFVGQFDKRYTMYERKLRYLTSMSGASVESQLENGFCGLPSGCSIKLEEVARERIVESIKGGRPGKKRLADRMREMRASGEVPSLESFLEENGLGLQDIYGKGATYTGLVAMAERRAVDERKEKLFSKGFLRLSTADSAEWMDWILRTASQGPGRMSRLEERFADMLYYTFYDRKGPDEGFRTIGDFLSSILSDASYTDEMRSVLALCRKGIRHSGKDVPLGFESALRLHCRYHRNQVLAAIGKTTFDSKYEFREGVLNIDEDTDILMINLNKSEDEFSPTTMYQDYALDEKRFHWQSQSTTSIDSRTGRRYTSGRPEHRALLFVRENKSVDGRAMPFIYLGKGHHESHSGSRPISIVWRMEERMPPEVLAYSPVNG